MNIVAYLVAVRILLFIGLMSCNGLLSGQVKNPFDIQRSEQVETPAPAPIEATDPSEVTKLDGDNPFSVSHIPIRKNQYKEIERLALPREEVQNSISLSYLPLWIIVASMRLLAYLLFMKRDHLATLLKSISNDNFMKLSNYESNGGRNPVYLTGYLLFILNFALLIYLIGTKHFQLGTDGRYWMIAGGVAAFFMGKHVINLLMSWVFRFRKESRLYDFVIITLYNGLGIVMLVINILIVFGPDGWTQPLGLAGIILFITGLLSRYYKVIRIGQQHLNSHFYHFFLYFCAFEFAPWVIVYTVFRDHF